MQNLRTFLVVGFFVMVAGCRSEPSPTDFHAAGWENAQDARLRFDAYKNVILACVCEDHWEDRGAGRLSVRHSKATVVRAYRGDWRVSETIAFVDYHDFPALTNNDYAGSLVFIFTDQHTNAEINLDEAGDSFNYTADTDRALQYLSETDSPSIPDKSSKRIKEH